MHHHLCSCANGSCVASLRPLPLPLQCAGLIGSATYGVASNITLVSVRVVNCQGVANWDDIVSGVEWVINDDRVRTAVPGGSRVVLASLHTARVKVGSRMSAHSGQALHKQANLLGCPHTIPCPLAGGNERNQ